MLIKAILRFRYIAILCGCVTSFFYPRVTSRALTVTLSALFVTFTLVIRGFSLLAFVELPAFYSLLEPGCGPMLNSLLCPGGRGGGGGGVQLTDALGTFRSLDGNASKNVTRNTYPRDLIYSVIIPSPY